MWLVLYVQNLTSLTPPIILAEDVLVYAFSALKTEAALAVLMGTSAMEQFASLVTHPVRPAVGQVPYNVRVAHCQGLLLGQYAKFVQTPARLVYLAVLLIVLRAKKDILLCLT